MTKILFFIPNLAHGGAEKVLVNLVNNMDKINFDITVMTLFDVGVNKQYLKSHIHYKSIFKKQFRGNSRVLSLFSPKFLHKKFIKENYDIEVAYLEGPSSRIISAAPCKKISWIHTELRNKSIFSVGFRSYKEALSCYNKYNKIAFVSSILKEIFYSGRDISAPGQVVYNTNETALIIQKSKEIVDDITFENEFNICSVGKIIEVKAFDRLAKVHKMLLDEGINHHIYIIGVGPEKQNIERYLKTNNLTDTFTFIGFKDNPYKYVSKCDLYVCSSYREGFSTAVTEALILGVPVVSTSCSGATELLGENNEYGLVVENSENGIYEGMKKMLTEKDTYIYYKKQAPIRGKRFSTNITTKAAEKMFKEL